MIFKVQDYLRNSVRLLSNKGIYLGLTNQTLHGLIEKTTGVSFLNALDSYSEIFPALEWKTDFQNTIDEALLSGIITSRLRMLSVRFDCSEQHFIKFILSPNPVWQNFVSLLFENKSKLSFKLIFCFDRNTHYSLNLLDGLVALQDKLFSLHPSFEFEHRSWKNPNTLKVFRGAKAGIVQRDTPSLSGFQFSIPNFDKRDQYIRLLGRNQMNWFSSESSLRYSYDYTKYELQTLSMETHRLQSNYESTVIIAAHQPPDIALSNLLEFAHIYSHG